MIEPLVSFNINVHKKSIPIKFLINLTYIILFFPISNYAILSLMHRNIYLIALKISTVIKLWLIGSMHFSKNSFNTASLTEYIILSLLYLLLVIKSTNKFISSLDEFFFMIYSHMFLIFWNLGLILRFEWKIIN
jgi:hypothetical protein